MPSCPYCLEEIKSGARKCPHCQSALEMSPDSGGNTVYVVDKGLIRFGKFISAALGFFLIVGAYLYGWDMKEALKKTSDAEIEVKRTLLSIEQQKSGLDTKVGQINTAIDRIKALEQEIVRHRDETLKTAAEVKELITDIRGKREEVNTIYIEMVHRKTLTATEAKAASSEREARGIKDNRLNLWKVGSTVRFRFLDGRLREEEIVRAAIAEWSSHVNLTIIESASPDAELRISFAKEGSWSVIGTDALGIPKDEPTINYGTLREMSDRDAALHAALHEFGHALGLQHEYLNPAAGNIFNASAVYDYFAKTFGFSRADIDRQVFNKVPYPGTRPYDPESVMNYFLPASLFARPEYQTRPGTHLSESDKRYIAALYEGLVIDRPSRLGSLAGPGASAPVLQAALYHTPHTELPGLSGSSLSMPGLHSSPSAAV
jgi:serralysin